MSITKVGAYRSMVDTLKTHDKFKSLCHHVMRGGRYEDAVTLGKYKVQYDRDGDVIRILVWNPDFPCVSIVIHPDDGATLDMLRYDQRCEVSGRMVKGNGTREMLKFAFELAKKEGAKTIQLTDRSKVQCGNQNIQLGFYYFLLHGKTWYERYFNFYPITYVKNYENAKRLREEYLDIDILKQQPCDIFTVEQLDEIGKVIDFPPVTLLAMTWEAKL
jgi:hypothetical protein